MIYRSRYYFSRLFMCLSKDSEKFYRLNHDVSSIILITPENDCIITPLSPMCYDIQVCV